MSSSGANLRMSFGSVKENTSCSLQDPANSPPFGNSVPITKLQKRDEVFPGNPQNVSELTRRVNPSGFQLGFESGDQSVERRSVVIAIRLHLNDSPLPFQKSKQAGHRAAVA
jgi:hypothetical protein